MNTASDGGIVQSGAELYTFTTSEVDSVTGLHGKHYRPIEIQCRRTGFSKRSEFSESNPITVNSDGLMSHFLTCSDGSLTLPVGFREMYDKQQNSINTLPAIFISVHFGLR